MAYISIIVCTRNRANSLVQTLKSIEKAIQTADALEIEAVIVNNNSTDDTQYVIKRWAATATFPVLMPFEERKGLSHARNTGMGVATGKLLAFTDDDCRLNPDYFVVLDRHYRTDNRPVLRGGRVELGDPADLPIGIKVDRELHQMSSIDHPGTFLIGANMILHRDLLDIVGLFDTRFGAGAPFMAAEETDYIYRCYLHKISVEYVPDLVVYHFHGRKEESSIIRVNHGYHVGGGALYAKYFTRWHLLRHFYWDFRKYLMSVWTGTLYSERPRLSYWSVIAGNLTGMCLYTWYVIKAKTGPGTESNNKL